MDNQVFKNLNYFNSTEEAVQSVKLGYSQAVLMFKEGFSKALSNRIKSMSSMEEIKPDTLDLSEVHVSLDQTNAAIDFTIRLGIIDAMQKYLVTYGNDCNLNYMVYRSSNFGYSFKDIRGLEIKQEFTLSLLPIFLNVMICLLNMSATCESMITEKESGVLSRDITCGLTLPPAMLGHILGMLPLATTQVIFSTTVLCIVFQTADIGVILYMVLLLHLQAICGMSIGLFVMTCSKDRIIAIYICIAFISPGLFLSGMMWPIIAMPKLLQHISIVNNYVIPGEVSVFLMMHGSLEHSLIWLAPFIPIFWTLVFFTASLIMVRIMGFDFR